MSARRREKAWNDFASWCKARGLRALPAHPWTVAAYARWCEARHRYPVILKQIKAIGRAHVLACASSPDRHPTVTRTLRTIESRNRSHADGASLFPADEIVRAESPPAAKPARHQPARTPAGAYAPRLAAARL